MLTGGHSFLIVGYLAHNKINNLKNVILMAPSEYSHIYSSAYTECPPRAHHWDGNREQ